MEFAAAGVRYGETHDSASELSGWRFGLILGLVVLAIGSLVSCSEINEGQSGGKSVPLRTEKGEVVDGSPANGFAFELGFGAWWHEFRMEFDDAGIDARVLELVERRARTELTALLLDLEPSNEEGSLSAVNRSTVGISLPVSEAVGYAFGLAEHLHALTGGAFDMTIGPACELYAFDGKSHDSLPSPILLAEALSRTGRQAYSFDPEGPRVMIHTKGTILNVNAIKDGIIIDAALRIAREAGLSGVLVSYSGELGTLASRDEAWRFWAVVPDSKRKVYFSAGAVAVSCDDLYFMVGDKRYWRVLDPRTGYPIDNGIRSVVVFAGEAWVADGLATALAAMGPERALALVESEVGVDAIMSIDTGGGRQQWCSKGIVENGGRLEWIPD